MTITPMAPVLSPAPVDAAAAATSGDGAGAFGAALMAAHLELLGEPAADASAPSSEATSETGILSGDADPTQAPTPHTLPDPTLVAAAVQASPALAAAAVAAGPVPAPVPSPLVADAVTTTPTSEATPGEPMATLSAQTVGSVGSRGRSAQAPAHTGVLPGQVAAAAQAHARPGGAEDASVPEVARGAVDATTDEEPAAPAHVVSAPDAADTAPSAAIPSTAPVTAPAPMRAATSVDAAPATPTAPANPVLDQVAPVFSRLVSGPEGQHRMTLRLHPADLGEIHLTVTVKGDSVAITVSARPEAREALADGSSQLRSLLDSVGRTADRIVFRDLPGTGNTVQVVTTGGDTGAQSGASYADSGRAGNGSGHQGHEGQGRAHRPDQLDSGRQGDIRLPAHASTRTTTTPAAGLVRGGLDVRM